MRRRDIALLAVGFAALLVVCAAPAGAGISVIDQSRAVSTAFTGQPPSSFDQTDTATSFAPFNDTINKSGSYTFPAGGPTVTFQAAASQNSTVDLSAQTLHVSATGQASFAVNDGNLPDSALGRSTYSVTFQLTSPANYTIVEQTDHQTQVPNSSDFEAASDGAQLLQGTKELIPFPLFRQPSLAPVTFTGTLAPGTYLFKGEANAFDNIHHGSASFSADLTVTTGTSAVPLPPALWMALTTIGGIAIPLYVIK